MGIQCTKRIWHGKLSNFYTPHNKNEYLSTHASIVEINYIESDLSFGNKTLNNAAFWSSFVKSAVSNSRGQTQNRMHFFISNTSWTIKKDECSCIFKQFLRLSMRYYWDRGNGMSDLRRKTGSKYSREKTSISEMRFMWLILGLDQRFLISKMWHAE